MKKWTGVNTPRLIWAIGVIITIEMFLMLAFSWFSTPLNKIELSIIDALILGALSIPALFFLIVKPALEQAHEEERKRLMMTDHLTGLHLEPMFKQMIKDEIEKDDVKFFSVVLFDPSRISQINSKFGIECGDSILKMVAERLEKAVGTDGLVGRLKGDNFIVILKKHGKIEVKESVIQIIGKLEEPYVVKNNTLDVLFSAGVAEYPKNGKDADSLIKRSSIALQKGRSNNKSVGFFEEEDEIKMADGMKIFRGLRQAMGENELVLHYQPKVDLSSGKVVGAEALIRWNGENGYPPGIFIPIAEETGLIREITLWVIYAVADQCREWNKKGLNIKVAINISAKNLHDPRLVQTIEWACHDYDLEPEQFMLEVTESAIMGSPKEAIETLNLLSSKGFTISLDDFGTGYSSLAYLKNIPASELKLDRSFVKDICIEERDALLVKFVINLAKEMNISTVSEGVETKDVLEMVRGYGCDKVQGYYFSKPLPVNEFYEWASKFNDDDNASTNKDN